MHSQKILRLKQASEKTGLSRSSIYKLLSTGEFPKQIQLSARRVGFIEAELDAWLAAKAEDRNKKTV